MTEIRKFMCLSTCHIPDPEGASQTIEDERGVTPYDYGWWVWVPDDVMAEHEACPYIDGLLQCLLLARSFGCDYLQLDNDGPIEPNLPVFDW